MLITILIFLASIIPSVLVIVLLTKRKPDPGYKKACHSALFRGLISVLPILGASAILYLLNASIRALFRDEMSMVIYYAVYTFVVLAGVEETVKYVVFRLLLKKQFYACTWADVVALMVIIGAAFGLIEDLPYAFGANPIQILVRGLTMGHVGYGFLMGWFYGKHLFTGKKIYSVIAFGLPFLLHGIYDFSLTEELRAMNENLFSFTAVGMAVLDLVLIVLMISFFIRSKKKEIYNQPLSALQIPQPEQG